MGALLDGLPVGVAVTRGGVIRYANHELETLLGRSARELSGRGLRGTAVWGRGVDVQRFPKVADHMRRMDAQPQVKKVVALHQP